jgi:hypothetical protein
MRRFLGFIAAAGIYGVASVVIATLLFAISIYEHTRDKNVVSYVFVATAALVFCIGAFIAWLKENTKYEAEKAKHDEPNFVLRVESILTFYDPQSNITTVCFAANIINRGAASHASGWHIRYQSHSIDVSVKYVSLAQERVELPAMRGRKLILKRPDLLPARCLPAIERGHSKHGRILFEVPGDRRQEIYSGNAAIWLGCFDNAERLSQSVFKSTPEVPDLQAYPDEEVN